MENNKHFCTCTDLNCRLNPRSYAKGCDLCVKKNLQAGEIPSCFFRLVNEDISELKEFTIECFVNFYLKNKKQL